MRNLAVLVLSFSLLSASAQGPVKLDLVPWANGIGQIVGVTNCGDDRLFAVSQWGAIFVVTDSMTVLSQSFLNISSQVINGGERGMLGLAFDPD
ncbi:MAG TPA: cadherin, partial [Flavobacteriales bacterium]|nr:cadherin [Flavobacteriales bacterium]